MDYNTELLRIVIGQYIFWFFTIVVINVSLDHQLSSLQKRAPLILKVTLNHNTQRHNLKSLFVNVVFSYFKLLPTETLLRKRPAPHELLYIGRLTFL